MVTNGFELKANVNIAQLDHDGLVFKCKVKINFLGFQKNSIKIVKTKIH